jgi:hypothetical protein
VYSTRILTESKQLTNELRRNRDYYGGGDIFTQRNIDLCNQYLAQMDAYTLKDIKRVSLFDLLDSITALFIPFLLILSLILENSTLILTCIQNIVEGT